MFKIGDLVYVSNPDTEYEKNMEKEHIKVSLVQ